MSTVTISTQPQQEAGSGEFRARAFRQGLTKHEVQALLHQMDEIRADPSLATGDRFLDDTIELWEDREHFISAYMAITNCATVVAGFIAYLWWDSPAGCIIPTAIFGLLLLSLIGINWRLNRWWKNSLTGLARGVRRAYSVKAWIRYLTALLCFIKANTLLIQELDILDNKGDSKFSVWEDRLKELLKTLGSFAPDDGFDKLGKNQQISDTLTDLEESFVGPFRDRADNWTFPLLSLWLVLLLFSAVVLPYLHIVL